MTMAPGDPRYQFTPEQAEQMLAAVSAYDQVMHEVLGVMTGTLELNEHPTAANFKADLVRAFTVNPTPSGVEDWDAAHARWVESGDGQQG